MDPLRLSTRLSLVFSAAPASAALKPPAGAMIPGGGKGAPANCALG
jgi:hypothetical protein